MRYCVLVFALSTCFRLCSSLQMHHRELNIRIFPFSLQKSAFVNPYCAPINEQKSESTNICGFHCKQQQQRVLFSKIIKIKESSGMVHRKSSYSFLANKKFVPKIGMALVSLFVVLWYLSPKIAFAMDASNLSLQQNLFGSSNAFRRFFNLLPSG